MRRKRRLLVATIESRIMPKALCPYCGEVLDGVTGATLGATAAEFKPGDFSMCGECGEVLCYDGRFYQRVPPKEAERVLAESPLLRGFRDGVLLWRGQQFASKTGKPQ